MNTKPYISVIVPLYNEQRRLERCLDELHAELTGMYKYEVILVDNASLDQTPMMADLASRTFPSTRAIHLPRKGKGYAVREGMLAADGHYRYMCDVDLSTPAEEVHRFIEYARRFDIVIGSREVKPELTHTDIRRKITGRVFHSLVHDLVPGIRDTQCGFKIFRDYAAKQIFENVTIMGWAFDVEVLYLAHLFGFGVHELPVPWTHDADSRVNMLPDSLEMLYDISQIKPMHARSEKTIKSQTKSKITPTIREGSSRTD